MEGSLLLAAQSRRGQRWFGDAGGGWEEFSVRGWEAAGSCNGNRRLLSWPSRLETMGGRQRGLLRGFDVGVC